MRLAVAIMVAMVVPGAAMAAPVSLKCVINDRDQPFDLNVDIDDAAHTVSTVRPDTGGGREFPAEFLPNEVRFGVWTIDRITMKIVRQNDEESMRALHMPPTTEGTCVMTTVKRAF